MLRKSLLMLIVLVILLAENYKMNRYTRIAFRAPSFTEEVRLPTVKTTVNMKSVAQTLSFKECAGLQAVGKSYYFCKGFRKDGGNIIRW
jgi:hypothetical protein